ncbi:MAG TPA: helix-turn-helix transcriptional regulator [Anaerolineales bacterium]|nr:helix-turn-helix transcriptional regulator [Anaerolineales bacterium]
MDVKKQERLRAKGWKVGSVDEFLDLSPEEAAYVELKLALSEGVRKLRLRKKISQVQLARSLGSSQSRVAKIEVGDSSVSLDLVVRSLIALGASASDLAKMISSAGRRAAA